MSKIQWTEKTWNPLVGCSRVSEGCRHCYAERTAFRNAVMGIPQYKGLTKKTKSGEIHWTGEVRLVESVLDKPLHWQKPSRIFVNSMSDLFHDRVKDEWIDRIFAIMATACQHTFQVLTKRPARMVDYAHALADGRRGLPPVWDERQQRERHWEGLPPNVWLGASVEDQTTADERIPLLLQTPAAIRWVSYEPALGPVDFSSWLADGLDWIVVGGESGPGARRFDLAWARPTNRAVSSGGDCGLREADGEAVDFSRAAASFRQSPRGGHSGMVEGVSQAGVPLAAARAEPRVRLIRTPAH